MFLAIPSPVPFEKVMRRSAALVLFLVPAAPGLAQGAGLDHSFTITDGVGDSAGFGDLVRLEVSYSKTTGDFQIDITASESDPFVGRFGATIEIVNVAESAGLAVYPIFDLAGPRTTVRVIGTSASLTALGEGDQVRPTPLRGTAWGATASGGAHDDSSPPAASTHRHSRLRGALDGRRIVRLPRHPPVRVHAD